ncbi:MAG: Ycf66 family protein [Cyanobacteriota bacterium]
MLAILIGSLALLVGLALLLEPLLLPELSRPRDALWAAVVLLLGLVLVTAAERLQGAPMLGVLCGGLLVGRLGTEVGQQRWQQLPPDERLQLRTVAHWQRRALDLAVAVSRAVGLAGALLVWVAQRSRRPVLTKRWVRADLPPAATPAPEPKTVPETETLPEPEPEPTTNAAPAPEAEPAEPVVGLPVAIVEADILEAEILEAEILDGDISGGDIPEAEPVRVIAHLGEVDALLDAADG